MKISHRLLLLVLTPLIVELGFIFWLYSAFTDMERKAQQAEDARQVATHMNNFIRGGLAIAGKNRFAAANGELLSSDAEIIQECRKELRYISAYADKNPEEKKLLNHITVTIEDGIKKGEMIRQCIRAQELETAAKLRKELVPLLNDTLQDLEMFRKEATRLEEYAPHIVRQRQHLIKLALTIGVSLNIVMALVMALLANKSLVQRLRVLSDNARALQSNQPLKPSPGGKDEIAQLDSTFREMAATIAAAREYEKLENERLQTIISERQELDRMKQQFVAVVSHELRTPLTNMGLFLDNVSKGLYGKLDESGTEVLGGVQQGVGRLIKLTTDLLDVERLEAGAFQLDIKPVPVDRCVQDAVNAVAGQAKAKGVTVEVSVNECIVNADRERLVQVLVNLLSNAIKFSPSNSTVSVRTTPSDAMLRVEIRDDGPGVPEALQERIFDRFQQVNIDDSKKLGGAGLGLAICKSIVEQHGGKIGVDSTPGAGATFWFTLQRLV